MGNLADKQQQQQANREYLEREREEREKREREEREKEGREEREKREREEREKEGRFRDYRRRRERFLDKELMSDKKRMEEERRRRGREERRKAQLKVDYFQALEQGHVRVAYARVMLVGPGGVGKSSLLNGLMNLPLSIASSTQIADTFSLRSTRGHSGRSTSRPTESYWAKCDSGGQWVRINDQDELKELALLVKKVSINQKSDESDESVERSPRNSGKEAEFSHPSVQAIFDKIFNVDFRIDVNTSLVDSEVYLRVWDCGGQPVFLNLLPAFLTARTLFMLIFNASLDLQSPCRHLSHFRGQASEELDEMTTLQLMVQWMATIHTTLLKKKSSLISEPGASNDGMETYPQILPVGTHGDAVNTESRKEILDLLFEVCKNAAFAHLLRDTCFVDNTTAGKGEAEDPTYQTIRQIANKFADTDLSIDTPITWVLFRKVFERFSRGKPIVPLEEVKELATACLIPKHVVKSVLEFYHELSVFLHYSRIPSLSTTVIADPQWLIKQMAQIMALEGFEEVKNDQMWRLLREDGILVENLYKLVFRNLKELEPQKIIDLLEHFLIVFPIHSSNKHPYKGREYFVPSMLPLCTEHTTTSCIQSTTPLHLVFSTNYIPPGFFTRLVAAMSIHPNLQIDFSGKLYRNAIKFHYGPPGQLLDKVSLTQDKSSIYIQVQRVSPRSHKCPLFVNTCHEIMKLLPESFEKVKEWLPGIDVSFASRCPKCPNGEHLVLLPNAPCVDSRLTVLCQAKVPVNLTPDQFWFYTQELTSRGHESADVPDFEIIAVSEAVESANLVSEFVAALEMSEQVEGVSGDVRRVLSRWQTEMRMMDIPQRPHLLMQALRIGLRDLHYKLLYKEITSSYHHDEQVNKPPVEQTLSTIPDLISSDRQQATADPVSANVDASVFAKMNDEKLSLDDDLGDVLDAVEPLASKWRRLCTKLRLKESNLDTIERNNSDVGDCLHKAMGEWLRLNYNHQRHGRPSWRRLAEAVSSLDYRLSEKIATRHTH